MCDMLPRWTTATAAAAGWVAASAESGCALHPEKARGRKRDKAMACLERRSQRRSAGLCTVDLSRTGARAGLVPVADAKDQPALAERSCTSFALAVPTGDRFGPRLANGDSDERGSSNEGELRRNQATSEGGGRRSEGPLMARLHEARGGASLRGRTGRTFIAGSCSRPTAEASVTACRSA
jgi:hypothetical protein